MKKEAVAAGSGSMKQKEAPQGMVGESKSVVGSIKGPATQSKSLAPQTRQSVSKKAVPVGAGGTKQETEPQGTIGENKSVVGSNKAPSTKSKYTESEIRRRMRLLYIQWFTCGLCTTLIVAVLIILLVFMIKKMGTEETPATSTTSKHSSSMATSTPHVTTTPIVIQPAVCEDLQGVKVKNECMITPSSCNRQCEYYKYEWPLKNVSIKNGSFDGASHVCQTGSGQLGLCNTDGKCIPNEINSNARENRSTVDEWEDTCDKPDPCWDGQHLDKISGKGVVKLEECKNWDVNQLQQYCQNLSEVFLSVQHRHCKHGKRCNGPPFQVWKCGNCVKSGTTFNSCQGNPNGAKCNPGQVDWYCLGGECVKIAGDIASKPDSECGRMLR